VAHATVTAPNLLKTRTTLGLVYSEGCEVTRVLIGGPAFRSGQISEGDTLVSIEGRALTGLDQQAALALIVGNDEPGSQCVIEVKEKTSGIVKRVVLERIANDLLAHKRQMFDAVERLKDRLRSLKDTKGIQLMDSIWSLWTKTMLEEHQHESTCLDNIAAMRRETTEFVQQLRALFVRLDKPSVRIPQTPTAAADEAEGAGGAGGAGRGSSSGGSGKGMIEEKPGGVSRMGHHMKPRYRDSTGRPALLVACAHGQEPADAGKDTVLEEAAVGVAAGGGDIGEGQGGQGGQGGGFIDGGDKRSLDQTGATLVEEPSCGEASGSESSPPSLSSETGSESARSSRSRLSDSHGECSPQTARDKARVPFWGVGCMRVCRWVCDDRDSSSPLSLFHLPSEVATERQNLTQTDCECVVCARVLMCLSVCSAF
jgi:hypothetical protein